MSSSESDEDRAGEGDERSKPIPSGASKRWVKLIKDYAEDHPTTEILSETTTRDRLLAETANGWAEQQASNPQRKLFPEPGPSQRQLFPEAAPPLPDLRRVSPPAAPAPAPAPPSAGVTLLRDKMAVVKGQPNLLGKLETIVKATEKRRRRAENEKGGASSSTQLNINLNMVFYGPPGTGKTSTVKVLAKVFAAPEVGLLKSTKVTELNKETDLDALVGRGSTKLTLPQKVGKLFEQSQGATLFLDEVHQRGDTFAQALLPLLSKYEGKVMVVIAGYSEKVNYWLRNSDPGMMSRFPRSGFVTFESLPANSLVEIGMATLAKRGYSLHPSASDTFRCVMEHVCVREPAENARGADNEVVAMTTEHEARDDLDDEDMCITTEDILTACPFADSPPPAAAASQHAPAAADEVRDRSTPAAASTSGEAAASPDAPRAQRKGTRAPAPAAEVAAGGAPRRGSKSQASSSAAGAESSSARAPAAASSGSEEPPSESEEDAPLSDRPRPGTAPSKPTAPTSSGKRKRGEAESGEARAEVELPAVSHEASSLAKAFVKGYELDEDADRITALDFIQDLAPHVKDKDLRATLLDCKRAGSRVRALLKEAFDAINEGKSDIVKRS